MRLGLAVPDLGVRRREAELMDDPALGADRHRRALDALARINRISFAAKRLVSEITRVHGRTRRTVRVLDVACGGGDVLLDVAGRARRQGVPVELHGCDVSAVALERAGRGGAVHTHRVDVLRDELPGPADVVTCNLFLHHLAPEEAVELLRRMAGCATASVLVQDLRRTPLGYGLAWLGLHTLTRSDVARVDGLRSVRGSFTLEEMGELCREAGLDGARVSSVWPQRMLVEWRA